MCVEQLGRARALSAYVSFRIFQGSGRALSDCIFRINIDRPIWTRKGITLWWQSLLWIKYFYRSYHMKYRRYINENAGLQWIGHFLSIFIEAFYFSVPEDNPVNGQTLNINLFRRHQSQTYRYFEFFAKVFQGNMYVVFRFGNLYSPGVRVRFQIFALLCAVLEQNLIFVRVLAINKIRVEDYIQ